MPVSPKPLWLEWIVILLIRLMIVVTRLMPLGWARALGRAVGAGLYHFNGRMRRVAIRNLELAYPEWTPNRRRVMARQSVQSTGELMAEMGRIWTQPWVQTTALLEVDGLGCVTEPLASGQGVIVLGPHLGNWELLGMHLATLGNLVALYEPIPLKKLDELVHRCRQCTGGKLVPTTPRGIAELVRSVRAGGITGILPDQVPNDGKCRSQRAFLRCRVFHRRIGVQPH
jgi:KDO2-lipid IV(A) lauroyltransferase